MQPNLPSQRGVALIMAILIVAVAVIAATAMVSRQAIDIQRTANVINGNRAWLYSLGGESLAVVVLQRDGKDNAFDALNEDWAVAIPVFPVEGGVLQGHIEDLQGRFNLNNLVAGKQIDNKQFHRLRRLLQALEIDPALADAVADWLDPDLNPRGVDGAEDDIYLTGDLPYRAANRKMVSPSELRLVRGFTPAIVDRLAPYVAALPFATPINVNTAPVPVMMALAEDMSEDDARTLVSEREDAPWESTTAFLAHGALAGRTIDKAGLSVASRYFLSTIHTEIDTSRVTLTSLLYRGEDGTVRVLMRSRAGY